MPQFSQKQVLMLAGGGVAVITVILLIVLNLRSASTPPELTLTVWGPEPRQAVEKLVSAYRKYRPNVTMSYREIDPSNYEATVVNALASGRGPDVFLWPNREVLAHRSKFAAALPQQFGLAKMRDLFPTVAEQELSADGEIYGLPAYLDTLALLYNRDFLDEAALVGPPRTWEDFRSFIPYLRLTNDQGQIVRAAAAIGGSERSVANAADILGMLFLQNGATVEPSRVNLSRGPGLDAFNFYLQFANTASPYYTWTDGQDPSFEEFGRGEAAMAFGYASDRELVRARSPLLNFAAAPAPQVNPQAGRTIARYHAWVVSRQSYAPAWGWDFAIYAATVPEVNREYLELGRRPAALKSEIGRLVNDPEWGAFARQALTARAWSQAGDRQTREVLDSAIRSALRGTEPSRALQEAEIRLTEIFRNQT